MQTDLLDKIYNDFTTSLLPTIQTGLSITKDYFIDLFGRYIKYLIVTDAINISIAVAIIIAATYCLRQLHRYCKNPDTRRSCMDDGNIVFIIMGIILSIAGTIAGVTSAIHYSKQLVKTIYIPEVRIYEEIQNYKTRQQNQQQTNN